MKVEAALLLYILLKMQNITSILRDRCIDLITKISILHDERYVSIPLTRYILSIPYMLPIEHILLAERPYNNDIFPYVASAMSYSSEIDIETTPIVHFLALDISNGSDLEYETCRDWFRDSWKYLNNGILLLNVCTTYAFMDNRSEKERVAMEEFIRDIIHISLILSKNKIHIYALGNPARHSAGRIRSSISKDRTRVTIHECKNPAGFKHVIGDKMSPTFTIGEKALTKLLVKLIKTTLAFGSALSEEDYHKMSTGGEDERSRLVKLGSNNADVFTQVSAYFKANTGAMVERNDELFDRAAKEMREFVLALNASKIKLIFAQVSEPPGTSKPAYFNNRTNYNKDSYSRGSSSKASVKSPYRKQAIGFADDDTPDEKAEGSTSHDTIASDSNTSTPRTSGFPQTPVTPRTPLTAPGYARSAAGHSTLSKRAVSIGFADDSDDEDNDDKPPSADFDINLTSEEIQDLSIISDYMDPANDNYNIESAVIEFINETLRTKKATSSSSQEVLKIIRDTKSNSNLRSISNSLGMDDIGIVDMSSPIMQWILKYLTK